MKFYYNNQGKEIEVELERWIWGVVYDDGTELRQFDANGKFHRFQEIDQPRVKMFTMHRSDDIMKRIDMVLEGDCQLFHFYRNIGQMSPDGKKQKWRIFCFGWKDRKTGATSYNYILPDDRLVIADHDVPDLHRFGI